MFKIGDVVRIIYEFDWDNECCPECVGVEHIVEAPRVFTVVGVEDGKVLCEDYEYGIEFWAIEKVTPLGKLL